MKLLNLGCGKNYHEDWYNVDFKSNSTYVKEYNLLNGIPYPDNHFDVVYHSHVLEHFTKEDGKKFIKECYRVLKPSSIIRIAVPDLEQIAINYLDQLNKAWDDEGFISNYEWMKLELIDQFVRHKGGGEMGKYLSKQNFFNEKFLRERAGTAFDEYMDYFSSIKEEGNNKRVNPGIGRFFKLKTYLNKIELWLFKRELKELGLPWQNYKDRFNMRRFRLSGQVHQWMYDRLSLRILFEETNFKDFKIQNAFESYIPDWVSYELDTKNGKVRKPDSIFVEAIK